MKRILATAGLLLCSTGAAAWDWPWNDAPPERLAYCKGFVVGGLASYQSVDTYRTDLWLAWNYLIRAGAVDHSGAVAEYEAGRAQLDASMDAAAVRAVLDDASGECGLGRSGWQVTGW